MPSDANWAETCEGRIPRCLQRVLELPKQEVVQPRTIGTHELELIADTLHTTIHKLFNDSCRLLGCEIEGRLSEHTHEIVADVPDRLIRLVQELWQDEEDRRRAATLRREKLREYQDLKNRVIAMERELGISPTT